MREKIGGNSTLEFYQWWFYRCYFYDCRILLKHWFVLIN